MMSCKQVAWLMSSGQADDGPMRVRLGVRLHAAMCRHCRAARQAWMRVAGAARQAQRRVAHEPAADFEQRVLRALEGPARAGSPASGEP